MPFVLGFRAITVRDTVTLDRMLARETLADHFFAKSTEDQTANCRSEKSVITAILLEYRSFNGLSLIIYQIKSNAVKVLFFDFPLSRHVYSYKEIYLLYFGEMLTKNAGFYFLTIKLTNSNSFICNKI